MPVYEYRCRTCGERFELLRRSMNDDAGTVPCPDGHADTVRLLSMFATAAKAHAGAPTGVGGGCCGGTCGCGR
jgi:putative FmdB family regulatory protein